MTRKLKYYYSCISPFAYLGHAKVVLLAREFQLDLEHYPMPLQAVFSATGGVPVAQRAQVRKDYRILELRRWSQHRGIALVPNPTHFPTSPELADRTAMVLAAQGARATDFVYSIMRACWVENRDISDEAVVCDCIAGVGADVAPTLQQAKASTIGDSYSHNAIRAIDDGVFGSPSYVLDGELFWGQDRLELLEQALRSARASF